MHRGYVKLWRKSLDSGLLQNAEAWQLMTWCLLKASHKPHKQLVGKQIVELEPGQLVFGRIAAAKELRTTQQRIRTSLKVLENLEFLTIKPTNKFSVIAIIKWETYQQDQPPTNQQVNHQATIKQPSSNHQTTTNKNEEHYKNEENKTLVPIGTCPQQAVDQCPHQAIVDLYHEVLPELPRVKSWNEKRQKHLRARWRERADRQNLDFWKRYFEYVRKSPFLMGQRNSPGRAPFVCTLEWLVTQSNFTNVIEEKYHSER
jgi:hypothetical protein